MKTIQSLIADKIAENEVYIRILKDLDDVPRTRRSGSTIQRAADIIKDAGRPLHADEILVKLGKKKTRRNKVSLSSSMTHYASADRLFKKTAPNTFDVLTKH